MSSAARWPDAALAGLACSMRTFSGPSLLAVRGRFAGRARAALLAAATGELAMDKTSLAPDRTAAPGLGGRIVAGGCTGRALAGPAGLVAGAASAALGTFATFRARGLVVRWTGLPDPVVAVGEDLVAYGAAAIAVRAP